MPPPSPEAVLGLTKVRTKPTRSKRVSPAPTRTTTSLRPRPARLLSTSRASCVTRSSVPQPEEEEARTVLLHLRILPGSRRARPPRLRHRACICICTEAVCSTEAVPQGVITQVLLPDRRRLPNRQAVITDLRMDQAGDMRPLLRLISRTTNSRRLRITDIRRPRTSRSRLRLRRRIRSTF